MCIPPALWCLLAAKAAAMAPGSQPQEPREKLNWTWRGFLHFRARTTGDSYLAVYL